MGDFEKIREEFSGSRYIRVQPHGTPPYEKYQITYYVKSLYWDRQRSCPVERNQHEVKITLTQEYPRSKPICNILTPVFHPNFSSETICIGDHWAPSSSLVDVIVKIGEMLQFRDYNPKSAYNMDAARWVIENRQYLPIGKIDLYSPEPEVEIRQTGPNGSAGQEADDLEIIFGLPPSCRDIEIELK